MACKTSCKLCNKLAISQGITFDETSNTLNIVIPERSYNNSEKVCIVLAQAIPTTATLSALVYIFVGGNNSYPLMRCDCSQVTASELRSRTRYSTHVITNTTSAVFRLDGRICECAVNNLSAIPNG